MEDPGQVHIHAAIDAQRRGDHGAARGHWQAVLDVVPEHPLALNGLGADALHARDLASAIRYFERAAIADGKSSQLWSNLARAQNLAGDRPGERHSLEQGLALSPRDLAINIRLAQLHEAAQESAAAAEYWTMASAIAQATPTLSDEARRLIDQGRDYLSRLTGQMATQIDDALHDIRGALPPGERRRMDAAIDYVLGRRAIFLNQCSGMHVPFLPADEFFDRALFPWFAQLEAAAPVIRRELLASLGDRRKLSPEFTPYVDLPKGVEAQTWGKLDKSTDWSATHFWRDGIRDDAVCARFPQTAAVLDSLPLASLPQRMPTIFFSALAAKTHIPPHTGVTNARAIVHLPLLVPDGCRFRVGGETRVWEEDVAFAFDDTIEHEAWNDSDALRVVLILDTWNPHLTATEQQMIGAFYAAAEESDLAPTIERRAKLS